MTAPTDVARDLSAIEAMWPRLVSQAVHTAGGDLPGGNSTVQLSHVANLRDWQARLDDAEQAHYDDPALNPWPDVSHEDDSERPWLATVLQTLWFWSAEIRDLNAQPLEGRHATVASEARIIRHYLDQLRATLPEWEDLADDVATARRTLENVLSEGTRATERGVPCMYDECHGALLVRLTVPKARKVGPNTTVKVWELSDWHCPKCHRSWDEDAYARNFAQASRMAQIEEIDGETWWSAKWASKRLDRPLKTIRTWINRGDVPALCIIAGQRTEFVPVDVVRERDRLATERRARALAARKNRPVVTPL